MRLNPPFVCEECWSTMLQAQKAGGNVQKAITDVDIPNPAKDFANQVLLRGCPYGLSTSLHRLCLHPFSAFTCMCWLAQGEVKIMRQHAVISNVVMARAHAHELGSACWECSLEHILDTRVCCIQWQMDLSSGLSLVSDTHYAAWNEFLPRLECTSL